MRTDQLFILGGASACYGGLALGSRDGKEECRSVVGFAFDPDSSGLTCNEFFANVQTDAQALAAGVSNTARLIEALEDGGESFCIQTNAGISNRDTHEIRIQVEDI